MNLEFNRDLKISYNWLPINKNLAITNKFISGGWSIIADIDSTGHYLWLLANSKVDSKIFLHYLFVLNFTLHAQVDLKGRSRILLLDNATPHKSKDTKEIFFEVICYILASLLSGIITFRNIFSNKSSRSSYVRLEENSLNLIKLMDWVLLKIFVE